MSCCSHEGCNAQFDVRQARHDLKRYRKQGPDPTTHALVDILKRDAPGATIIDIGGGVGIVHHELLDAGAASATHVDVSQAYLATAKEEAERRSHSDRVRFVLGDFVAVAKDVAPADVVTLDRVICCYGDMESLVAASASRATKLYGVVFPRDRWYLKLAFASINLFKRVTRSGFRVYIHEVGAIDAAIQRQGLKPKTQLKTFVWHVSVYAR